MAYVEREQVLELIANIMQDCMVVHKHRALNRNIKQMPTADVAEVKHGEWVDRDGKTWCSLCDASNKQYKPPYCPHCGAKMDGGQST